MSLKELDPRLRDIMDMLVALAKGEFSRRIVLTGSENGLEGISALLNMIAEEWQKRILHFSFVHSGKAYEFSSHLFIELNTDFEILDIGHEALSVLNLDWNSMHHTSFLRFLTDKSRKTLIDAQKRLSRNELLLVSFPLVFQHLNLSYHFQANLQRTCHNRRLVLTLNHVIIKHDIPVIDNKTTENRMLQKSYEERKVQNVYNYLITKDLSEAVTLKQLCTMFGINMYSLKTNFKRLYNESVYDFYLQVRLKRALIYILYSSFPLKKIAQLVGFNNYSNFHRNFTACYNINPGDLRRKEFNLSSFAEKKPGNP